MSGMREVMYVEAFLLSHLQKINLRIKFDYKHIYLFINLMLSY